MGKNSAEYMRAYRARKKLEATADGIDVGIRAARIQEQERISDLEDEVRRLKQELAGRLPEPATYGVKTRFTSERASQQADRDAILRKVNKGG